MAGLLSPDSRVYQSWSLAADLVILNWLTIIGSIPLFTAGASLAATTRVTAEMVREEETYVVRSWWKYYRENFRQAETVWIPAFVLYLGFWLEQRYLKDIPAIKAASALTGLVFAGALLLTAFLIWYFPLITHFSNTIPNHCANAARLAFLCLPRTAASLLIFILPFALPVFFPGMVNAVGCFMVAVGISFFIYLTALLQKSVLAKLGKNKA